VLPRPGIPRGPKQKQGGPPAQSRVRLTAAPRPGRGGLAGFHEREHRNAGSNARSPIKMPQACAPPTVVPLLAPNPREPIGQKVSGSLPSKQRPTRGQCVPPGWFRCRLVRRLGADTHATRWKGAPCSRAAPSSSYLDNLGRRARGERPVAASSSWANARESEASSRYLLLPGAGAPDGPRVDDRAARGKAGR